MPSRLLLRASSFQNFDDELVFDVAGEDSVYVKQREEEHPHEVHDVVVEPEEFHWPISSSAGAGSFSNSDRDGRLEHAFEKKLPLFGQLL